MFGFEVQGKYQLKSQTIPISQIFPMLKDILSKYYGEDKITVNSDNLTIDGDLKSIWERALTKATITVNVKGDQLYCHAEGTVSFGFWPWVWFLIGLVYRFFLGIFLADLISFLFSKNKPKQYIKEAFDSLAFRLEQMEGNINPETERDASLESEAEDIGRSK